MAKKQKPVIELKPVGIPGAMGVYEDGRRLAPFIVHDGDDWVTVVLLPYRIDTQDRAIKLAQWMSAHTADLNAATLTWSEQAGAAIGGKLRRDEPTLQPPAGERGDL